jgi:hypothetical protein
LPALSAIELLMVPKSALQLNLLSALAGPSLPGGGGNSSSSMYRFPPLKLPTVLFFWGPFRLWPVTVNSLSVIETEYNQLLVPIRAEVNVSLQVLTPSQLGDAQLPVGAYNYSQKVKEVMAALNLANAAALGISASFSLAL